MTLRYWRLAAAAALMTGLGAGSALADSIDGNWCSTKEVKQFSIAGPAIVTPAGTHTTGNYSRHAFVYVVSESDPGAGSEVAMQLLNEEEVRIAVDGGEPEVWKRCERIS